MKLYGKNPVIERLKSNPKTIKKIYLQEQHPDGAYVRKKARKWGIPVYSVPRSKILKMGRNVNTQGILVEVDDFAYREYQDLLGAAKNKNKTIIFLDNLTDPQNFGAIIRSAACLGGFSIVIPKHDSVDVTEAVLRVSSGADNFVEIAKVSNLAQAIGQAKQEGFWIAGAVVEGGEVLDQAALPFPLAIVIGSEQKGIREGIRKKIDVVLTLPMAHARLSLNAAQAATIFCYEITKQKKNETKKNS